MVKEEKTVKYIVMYETGAFNADSVSSIHETLDEAKKEIGDYTNLYYV